MAKQRKWHKRKDSPKAPVSVKAQASASLASALLGRQVPDHELTSLGPANLSRRFDFDEPDNGPSIIWRVVEPFSCFYEGYSEAGTIDDQDDDALVDTTEVDPSEALTPITPMAEFFEQDVYPVVTNLLRSGVGTRPTISVNEMVRYFGMVSRAYCLLLIPLTVNRLAYHTDWSKIAPFTDIVPNQLYTIADSLEAYDQGIAINYLKYMRRLENLVMFPRILFETKRMMTPMMSIDLHGRVHAPVSHNPVTISKTDITTQVEGILDYLNDELVATSNIILNFLPFPIREQDPWAFPDDPVVDVERDSGYYNSGTYAVDTFGDTTDPANAVHLVCDEAQSFKTPFYTRNVAPLWSEVRLSTIFWKDDDVTDDAYKLITPHKYGNIVVIDDAGDSVTLGGTEVTKTSTIWPYIEYINCRFATNSVDFGHQKPGTFGCYIYYDDLYRMMRLDTHYLFNLEIMKDIAAGMTGAGLREIRHLIKQKAVDGQRSDL